MGWRNKKIVNVSFFLLILIADAVFVTVVTAESRNGSATNSDTSEKGSVSSYSDVSEDSDTFHDLINNADDVGSNLIEKERQNDAGVSSGDVKAGEKLANSPFAIGSVVNDDKNHFQPYDLIPDNFYVSSLVKWLRKYVNRLSGKFENPSQCEIDAGRLANGMLDKEEWTIPFLDSAGKPGPSASLGWLIYTGNYDQCRSAVAPPPHPRSSSRSSNKHGFKGEYCTLVFLTPNPFITPSIDVCLPDTCSKLEAEALVRQLIQQQKINLTLSTVEFHTDKTHVSTATVFAIIVATFFGSFVILGTVYDLVFVQNYFSSCSEKPLQNGNNKVSNGSEVVAIDYKSKSLNYDTISNTSDSFNSGSERSPVFVAMHNIFIIFSAYTNGKKLLTVTKTKDSLDSLHGIRYLTMCWVILGHTYFIGIIFTFNKTSVIPRYYQRWSFSTITNATFSVDTFFALSGMLVSYLTVKEMSKKGWKISWPLFYFHRFWRLTPSYMIVLVLSLGLTQYMGEGPQWAEKQPLDKDNCDDHWWKNLLYINNFEKFTDICMSQSWYLANDMQFFVLTPLILIPLYFHNIAGLILCFVLLVCSWLTTGILSSVNDWVPVPYGLYVTIEERLDYVDNYYIKPWCRVGPFLVGFITGYLLTIVKEHPPKLKWWVVAGGWIVCAVCAWLVVYGIHGDMSGDNVSSTEIAALYNAVSRSVWGACICWVIFACELGYGGPVMTFLSWSPFVVLGRLSYMTYLIHINLITVFYGNLGWPVFANDVSMASYFLGFATFSTFIGFIFVLVFECPMVAFEKFMLPRNR